MKIKSAQRINQVREYYFSRKLQEIAQMNQQGTKVINLGIGSPDLKPPTDAVRKLQYESYHPGNHAYQSYRGIPELRSAFAKWYQRFFRVPLNPDSEVLPLIGSKEGIMHLSMTYLDDGDRVLIPNPGYPAYRTAALLAGARPEAYLLSARNGWRPNLDALAAQAPEEIKLMWVNYPHMPTGTNVDPGFFRELIGFARTYNILICNDNPYSFILNNKPLSLLAAEGLDDHVLELNSLSKSHNMAGWRIGMLAGHQQHINNVLKFKSNMDSGMYRPLQLAAVEALDSSVNWYRQLNDTYRQRRKKVYELLDTLGCRYEKGQTGLFVWAAIPETHSDGFALSDEVLHRARVFLTPGGIFGSQGDAYIRVSLCCKSEIIEEALGRIQWSRRQAAGSR
ncbi:MAG: aminotransferase class I/II-fold pyridoxal phosphate-dependent enzyme [Bacteroidota bacterium]